MKFFQLPGGARFRYRDEIYRKVSPLMAAAEGDEKPRLIPRSASVAPLDEGGGPLPEALPAMLPGGLFEQAVSDLIAACLDEAARIDPPLDGDQMRQLAAATERIRADILSRLAAALRSVE